mgnify:FL=1
MQKRILCYAVACLFSLNISSTYIYEANQSLIDLTNQSGITNLNAGDDQVSSAFNLGFTFDFYGSAFTQARIATNGCLHFKTSGAFCNDFTPDPLVSQYTYTLLPFWTDLIRDNGSSMLAKSFDDKTVFGWYDMREYNRASDNSFEVILWTNDTFEFRYGALDIINHDVLIGEVGSGSKQIYQYYYHDECNTGSTNASNCVNTNWNDTSTNNLLENGGSLYGLGTGNAVDCSNPLNNSGCSGYADAYQTQQCNITQLYNESCPLYWEAFDDQQCDQDPQYAPFCQGYSQEDSVAYFDEETDYGYQEEDMWYDEEYDEWLDPNDPCYENRCEGFTDADWYALDVDQFGQEQVDDWLGNDVSFNDEGMIDFNTSNVTSYDDLDVQMDIFDLQHQDDMLIDQFTFQETFLIEDYSEPETFIEFNNVEELEEWFEEETRHQEEMHEEEFADLDEPEEEFIEEIFEEEAVEEIFEAIEERMAEAEIEEERLEREEIVEEFEEVFEEEFQTAEREEATGKSSISLDTALRVVASTLNTASKSISGTNSGASIHATGNNAAAGNVSSGSSSTNAGISTSSSPSMSDQFASAAVQTNQVLDMSSMSVSDTSSSNTLDSTTGISVSVVSANTNTNTVQDQMDTSINSMETSTDADTLVEDLIAQNLQTAQEEVEAEQEETGEYGSEDTIIAYMGFVPGFNSYTQVALMDQNQWYESKTIYSTTMSDNLNAFYGLASSNISKMNDIIELQPKL